MVTTAQHMVEAANHVPESEQQRIVIKHCIGRFICDSNLAIL